MKYFCVCIGLAFLLFTILSCKKTITQNNQVTGRWNIISDSSSANDSCKGCFNGSTYIGKQSDYYNFTNNGTLYIEENGTIDTAAYSILADEQINIATNYGVNGGGVFINSGDSRPLSYPVKNLTYLISNMTAHTLTLTTSRTATLTGSGFAPIEYIEIITFKR